MLEFIKSSFFIRILFSHIYEKGKLKIAKYNKSLQNRLNINIFNYKIFSGRYIIYESNRIGKEYDSYNDEFIYEGEYKNGERNGKGKEYDDEGNLLFEGEYKNGKKNGKGAEYYNGYLKFKGEYLNGERSNKGKEYRENDLKFEGEYKKDKRNGKGKEYFGDMNIKYEGEYLNGNKWIGEKFDENNNIILGKEMFQCFENI